MPSPLLSDARWTRQARLAMTGPNNPNYKRGLYTNKRRWRLEKPLNDLARELTGAGLFRLHRRIGLLAPGLRAEAERRLEALGDLLPDHWALRDPRRPMLDPRWYVPRRSWALCAKFLRAVRELYRGVFLHLSPMPAPMPTTYGRERRDEERRSLAERNEALEQRRRTELTRFADWCQRNGLEPMPAT